MSGVTVAPDQRTVFLGQVDPETTYEELCSIIHGGALESVRVRNRTGSQHRMERIARRTHRAAPTATLR